MSALVNGAWAVADAASVKGAVILVVADAVHVGVNAVAATNAQSVFWLPLQSQSPAGMPSPPQTPHSSRTCRRSRKHRLGCHRHRTRRTRPASGRAVVGVRIHVVVTGHLVRATEHFVLARAVVVRAEAS